MNNAMSGIKNILWAVLIVIALLALLVGLISSMVIGGAMPKEDGTLFLGDSGAIAEKLNKPAESVPNNATLNELKSSQDGGLEYALSLGFLCDKTFLGIKDYSGTMGGDAALQLWTDSGSGLSAKNAVNTELLLPDGSLVNVSTAASVFQPPKLVIYIGSDGLTSTDSQSFIDGYKRLISTIQSSSSATKIICCSIASVGASYPSADGLTKELISQANEWIRQVCAETGVYYADFASILNDSQGYLASEFVAPDGRAIGTAGIAKIVEYFRMHALQ